MGRVSDAPRTARTARTAPRTTTSSPRPPPTAGAARAPPVPHEDAILVPRVRAGDGDGGGVAQQPRTHLLHHRGQRRRVRHPAGLPQARRADPGVPELSARQADAGDDVHGVVPDARPPGLLWRRLRVRAHGTHRDAARTQRAAHDPPHLILLTPLLFRLQISYHWNISSKRCAPPRNSALFGAIPAQFSDAPSITSTGCSTRAATATRRAASTSGSSATTAARRSCSAGRRPSTARATFSTTSGTRRGTSRCRRACGATMRDWTPRRGSPTTLRSSRSNATATPTSATLARWRAGRCGASTFRIREQDLWGERRASCSAAFRRDRAWRPPGIV